MESVDVIIPANNAAGTIEASIRSALSQTHLPTRVIVVDDGSDDQTASVASALGQSITVLRQPNGGQGSARSYGASISNADLLMFLDADDVLHPEAIAALRIALLGRPECSLAYCRAQPFRDSADTTPLFAEQHDAEGEVWSRMIRRNFIRSPGCVLMRRAVLIDLGGWESSRQSQGCEDWDLWLRCAERGPFVRVADDLLRYRVHSTSFSGRSEEMDRSYMWVLRKHLTRQRRAAAEAAREGNWRVAACAALSTLCIWPRVTRWPLRRLVNSLVALDSKDLRCWLRSIVDKDGSRGNERDRGESAGLAGTAENQ